MLKGTPEQQIAQLKDYLVQLVLSLNEEENKQSEVINTTKR